MSGLDKYHRIISQTFRDLQVDKFELLGQGKAGVVCLVNDELVFKVPMEAEGQIARWQKNEAEVLRFLDGKLDFEIPKVLYSATSDSGLFIFGETLLSGATLTYDLFDTFDMETQADILRQLGRMVRKLHEAGGNDSSWQIYSDEDTLENYMNSFDERFSADVRNVFTRDEVAKIEAIAERYRFISLRHPVKRVLCHHDLHFFNLMFNMENKQITGILDFGCAGYSEPARDWHYYFDAKNVLEGYGETGDEFFHDRQRFHALSHSLSNLGDEIENKKVPYETLGFIRDYILNR